MSYKFVKVTTYYEGFLAQYKLANPGVKLLPYEQQYESLMSCRFGLSDYYQKALYKIGIEAHEIVVDALDLQKSWAIENGVNFTSDQSFLIRQLKKINPDIVYFENILSYSKDFLAELRRNIPSLRKIIGGHCAPYKLKDIGVMKECDFLITCSPDLNSQYQKFGAKSYLLYHAFDALLSMQIISEASDKEGIGFYGSLIAANGFHRGRIELLSHLIRAKIPLQIYSDGQKFIEIFVSQLKWIVARLTDGVGLAHLLKMNKSHHLLREGFPVSNKDLVLLDRYLKEPKFGIEMLKSLSNKLIGLNYHIDISANSAANMRMFETVGVGTCLVTDFKSNISDLFEPDAEIVTYKNSEECSEKIKWLLNNPTKCIEIGLAGNKRLLKNHSYEVRAKQLNEIILSELRTY